MVDNRTGSWRCLPPRDATGNAIPIVFGEELDRLAFEEEQQAAAETVLAQIGHEIDGMARLPRAWFSQPGMRPILEAVQEELATAYSECVR